MRGGEPEGGLSVQLPEKLRPGPLRDRGGVVGERTGRRRCSWTRGTLARDCGQAGLRRRACTHAWRRNSYKTSPGLLLRCERGAALRIKATARPLCSAGTGAWEPGLPTPDCAKSAVRLPRPALGLRAAPLPARGGTSWGDIAHQSLSWAEVGPPRPPPARVWAGCRPVLGLLGGDLPGRSPLGAELRGGAGQGRLSARLSRVVLCLPRGHLGDAPGRPPQLPRKLAAAHLVGAGAGWGQPGPSLPHPVRGPPCPHPHLRGLPCAHHDKLAVFQAHEHVAALLGHSHAADGHLHGQRRRGRQQSGGREGGDIYELATTRKL